MLHTSMKIAAGRSLMFLANSSHDRSNNGVETAGDRFW